MNIRKTKNDLEFFRDGNHNDASFRYITTNPVTNVYRTIMTLRNTTKKIQITRLMIYSDDTSKYSLRVINRTAVILQAEHDGSSSGLTETVLDAPESVIVEPGDTFQVQIAQSVAIQRDYYTNVGYFTYDK